MPIGIPKNGEENKGWFKKGHFSTSPKKEPYLILICQQCGKEKKFISSKEKYKVRIGQKKYCSYECYRKSPVTIETRKKMSKNSGMRGENHPNWKGGITKESNKIRESLEYKLWRKEVFKRDNWTCRKCGERGKKLQADHIKPFAFYPKLRFVISNGRTLCKECHKKTKTYLNNKKT